MPPAAKTKPASITANATMSIKARVKQVHGPAPTYGVHVCIETALATSTAPTTRQALEGLMENLTEVTGEIPFIVVFE